MQLRPLLPHDEALVWEFLLLAAHESSLRIVQSNSALSLYAQAWGRDGDCGVVAHDEGHDIGLVWARLFSQNAPGFGWLNADVPEISIAVRPEHQGQGVGQVLMGRFLEVHRPHFPGFSLSVRADNEAALRLYERFGFAKISGSERTNRAGGISFVMSLPTSLRHERGVKLEG